MSCGRIAEKSVWNLILTLFFVFPASTKAVELYSFFNNQCREITGYLVSEKNNIYRILSVNGRIVSLHKNNIKGVLVYNFVTPPLKKIKLKRKDLGDLLTFSIESEGQLKNFSGFPIQFIEDLIIFLETDGSTRVHKLDSILKIRPFKKQRIKKPGKKVKFDIQSSGYLQSCNQSGRQGFTRPNRILLDRIKIQQFLSNYKTGYESLKSFQERTYLYARPKIYNQKTKFGGIKQKALEKSFPVMSLPFIEWSSGRPFRVQNLSQIGSIFNEYGADLDPITGLKAEVKAHFFHSVFVGNLEALPGGQSFFTTFRKEKHLHTTNIDSSFNYSAMVGGDLGSHSLSIGLYYPVFVFGLGEQRREILATNNSYLLRYMYTNSFLRFYVTGSLRDEKIDNPSSENIQIEGQDDKVPLPENYSVKFFFVRSGVDFNLPEETDMGLNFLVLNLNYSENRDSGKAELQRMGGTVYIRKNFGNYVSFGIRFTYLADKTSYLSGDRNMNDNKEKGVLGFEGALVF